MATKLLKKLAVALKNFSGSSIKFQGHTGWQIDDLNPIWVRLLGQSLLSNPSDLPYFLNYGKLCYLANTSTISVKAISSHYYGWYNHGSGVADLNGYVVVVMKLFSWTNIDVHLMVSVTFTWEQFTRKYLWLVTVTLLKSLPYLTGLDKLKVSEISYAWPIQFKWSSCSSYVSRSFTNCWYLKTSAICSTLISAGSYFSHCCHSTNSPVFVWPHMFVSSQDSWLPNGLP